MTGLRTLLALGAAACGMTAAVPASAQFFLQSRDMSGQPVQGNEPGMGTPLPGATPEEIRAGLVWNMRAALNVAALQCQFEPTLMTVNNYNAILKDHFDELDSSVKTLNKYFVRTTKSKAAGQAGFDQFSTRTYSSFVTVAGQYGFCQTAGAIGRDAIYAPRGGFGAVAQARTRELRNSLLPSGEQRFPRYIGRDAASLPRLDAICWNKKGEWVERKCGAQGWPPANGVGVAGR